MRHRQLGFSLIEIVITLLISSMLIAAVTSLLLQSRRAFAKQEALGSMVEDGRYAIEVLAREFRMAGFLVHPGRPLAEAPGYRRPDLFDAKPNVANSGIDLQENEHIRGRFNSSGFVDRSDLNHVVFRYQLNPSGACSDPQYIVQAECLAEGGVWTHAGTHQDEGGTPCSAMVDNESGGRVAFTKAIFFFVNNTGDGPSLSCRAATLLRNLDSPPVIVDNNAGQAMPLVANVEALHVYYGEDTDADGLANRYVTADWVANWRNVVAARFYLVLRSTQTNVATTGIRSYRVEGQTFDVQDPAARRLYRVFSTTVALRN